MKKIWLLQLLLAVSLSAQTNFNSFVNYVSSLPSGERSAKLDSFMAAQSSFPLTEGGYAIFVYRGSGTSMFVSGDFNEWGNTGSMNTISGTNFFYLARQFENNARVDYKLVINGATWILDPLNPNTCAGGFGPNSELAMPGYIRPSELITDPLIPKGTIEERTIFSPDLQKTYYVKIYLPYMYQSLPNQYFPTVYFQDGYEYLDLANAKNVLDNTIGKNKCLPVIGVFVKPNDRNGEYAGIGRLSYLPFFANTLRPWIDSLYRTLRAPQYRLVIGDSYGANISALIAYNYPELFGRIGLHSSAFQPNNYEAYNLFTQNAAKNIKIFSIWGTYESIYTRMRTFRDILTQKGYEFHWSEFPEGHSWGLWKANIDTILIRMFPMLPGSVNEEKGKGNTSFNVYPNPATDYVTVPVNGAGEIIVYSGAGEEVQRATVTTDSGSVTLTLKQLPGGVYLVRYINRTGINDASFVRQ